MEGYLESLGENFVGLWRYKKYGEPSNWCVTIRYNGDSWDLDEESTIEEAFESAIKLLERLKNE